MGFLRCFWGCRSGLRPYEGGTPRGRRERVKREISGIPRAFRGFEVERAPTPTRASASDETLADVEKCSATERDVRSRGVDECSKSATAERLHSARANAPATLARRAAEP